MSKRKWNNDLLLELCRVVKPQREITLETISRNESPAPVIKKDIIMLLENLSPELLNQWSQIEDLEN